MYILKNAVTSIIRNKGRNLLIGIIILVISATTAITLAINNSSTSLINSYKYKYEPTATLGVNRQKMMGDFNPEDRESSHEKMQKSFEAVSNITIKDLEKYGDSDYVKASQEQSTVATDMPTRGGNEERGGKRGFSNSTSGDFTLIGYSSLDAMNDFIEGSYKVTAGEVPTDFTEEKCLINKELATLNNLKVNDKITLVDSLVTRKPKKSLLPEFMKKNQLMKVKWLCFQIQ